jgi:hypothetical protein
LASGNVSRNALKVGSVLRPHCLRRIQAASLAIRVLDEPAFRIERRISGPKRRYQGCLVMLFALHRAEPDRTEHLADLSRGSTALDQLLDHDANRVPLVLVGERLAIDDDVVARKSRPSDCTRSLCCSLRRSRTW